MNLGQHARPPQVARTMQSKDRYRVIGGRDMDILDLVYLVVPCAACGGPYEVSARVARSSDTMLHEGCPVQNPRNCPELHYASLVDPKALDELCAVWAYGRESRQPPVQGPARPSCTPAARVRRQALRTPQDEDGDLLVLRTLSGAFAERCADVVVVHPHDRVDADLFRTCRLTFAVP
jgi:hypothetical protein